MVSNTLTPIITTTRFNNETWDENVCFRDNYKLKGCIYNTPVLIKSSIKENTPLFVIEMNNSLNRIEGIGLIINKIKLNVYYNIHTYKYYNIYTYKGKYRIDRSDIETYNIELLHMLESILFKGKTNVKRGTGFVTLSDKLLEKYRYNTSLLSLEIKDIFMELFKSKNIKKEPY